MADSSWAALQAGTSRACPSTQYMPVCPCPRATRRTMSGACTRRKSYPSRAPDPTFGLDHPEEEENKPLTLRLDDLAFMFALGSMTSWYFCQKGRREKTSQFRIPGTDARHTSRTRQPLGAGMRHVSSCFFIR